MIPQQLLLDLPAPERSGRADFLPGPSNAEALDRIGDWRNWPEGRLLLVGPRGSGRSHLLRIWAAESEALALPPSALPGRIAEALDAGQPLALDDADRCAGDPAREEALFHLLNHARAAGLPVLLVARDTPGTWGLRLPDLESRLQTLAVVRTERPDDTLLTMVLVKLCDERQLSIPPEVLTYLVPRMDRSLAAARDLTAALDRAAVVRQRPVTRALAAEVLAGLDGSAQRP